jgi:hypothetical protein
MRASDQKGAITDFDILAVLLFIVIALAIALPKFIGWQKNAEVPPAVTVLRRLAKAEATYRASISVKSVYGSLDELVATGLLEADFPKLAIDRNYEETRFCAPLEKYVVDSEGKVFEGETAACRQGEPAGVNLKEIK